MANTLLTPDMITREALRILHQKLAFIGSINRQYDESFGRNGAKIGDSLRIRLPNKYSVRTGSALSTQDTTESNVSLTVATQKGVDTYFGSAELALSLDDFAKRILEPATSVLAANIESDVWGQAYKKVFNLIDSDGNAITFLNFLNARRKLNENLAPDDGQRTALISPSHSAVLVNALSGNFNPQQDVSKQQREGFIKRLAGFDFYDSTHVTDHTTGTAVEGDTLYNVNGANQSGASLTVNTGTTTLVTGDVITIAGCNAVHDETKVSYGYAKQFVITSDSGASATTLNISPSIVLSGPRRNVSAAPTDTGAITKVGAGNAELLTSSMVYHKDFFTFVTADLPMPDGVHFATRKTFDGIAMRIIRDYDIQTDQFPCRIDVLYGCAQLYPEWACRIHADG